jgi:hypothetical protein
MIYENINNKFWIKLIDKISIDKKRSENDDKMLMKILLNSQSY